MEQYVHLTSTNWSFPLQSMMVAEKTRSIISEIQAGMAGVLIF